MSRRGGGGGGRRSDQYSTTQSPSFNRGGGGGRGRGRGGPYNQPGPAPSRPATTAPPAASDFPSLSSRAALPMTSSSYAAPAPPPSQPVASSSRAAAPPQAAVTEQVVKEMEKKLVIGDLSGPPVSSKQAARFPNRPGFGTAGRKYLVRANHFLVDVADKDLHHYDVTITPEVTSKKVNRDVISLLESTYRNSHLGTRRVAYDGRKSLYTAGPLPFESKEFVIKLVESDDKSTGAAASSSKKKKEREFKVAIKFASKPDVHHLKQFLMGRQVDSPQETIQVLDIVLRARPSNDYVTVGRSFFSRGLGEPGPLGDGLEYWRGYYQSLRPTQMGLSLNIDVSARGFYESIPVSDFAAKYLNLRDVSRKLADQDRIKLKKALRSVKVQISHREYAKTYKITDVTREPLSHKTFALEDKRIVSVVDYFRDKYQIQLRYTNLPALQAGSDTKPVFLPMELCKIVEGQRYSKKLNERQVTALLRATCQRPNAREGSIKEMVQRNQFNKDELVSKDFGIHVKEELTVVEARVLQPPTLNYHKESVNPQCGAWNMINKRMVNGGRVDFWACVNFSNLRPNIPDDFCGELVRMCSSKGMVFNPNPVIPLVSARPIHIERTLIEIDKQCKQIIPEARRLQLLIVILPDVSGSYGKIKRICETELGIISQCCQPRQASKMSKQYLENVSLKVNVKVGGRNTVLNDAVNRRIPLVTDRPTIIFGADVTHPPPGEDSSPSIAAVVASMDWPEITKYRGIVSAQTHREEIIQDLYKQTQDPVRGLVHSGMIRELFIAFRRQTGQKPDRIIFYRDGVSEGQFSQVLLHEMDAIRKACNSLEEGYLPPATFVVVQKRHHTRLFPVDNRDTDRSGNILPGTVIDTKICHKREFDFYLNSHAGIQGTSRPTHYHVLYDENSFTADKLQTLTNNLCYTYARCTRSVSIVPPAYYAHLAAFRARYYIEGDSSDGGSTAGEKSLVQGQAKEIRPLPVIKDNIKDVMFYC